MWRIRERGSRRSVLAVVSAVALAAGLYAGWQARETWHQHKLNEQRIARLIKAILHAHEMFSVREDTRPEFAPDALDKLNSFAKGRVGFTLKFPDEQPKDFQYLGGRLFPIDGSSALLLTFRNGHGPVSVAAFRDPFPLPDTFGQGFKGDAPVTVLRDSGYTVATIGKALEPQQKYLAGILHRVPQE